MIDDSRFWIFLIVLLVSAYLAAEIRGRIRRKKNPKRLFYIAGAMAASVCLWLSHPYPAIAGSQLFHISNAVALALGVFIGLFPFFFFILLFLPLIISHFVRQPVKPLLPEREAELGILKFLPSEEGRLTMVWDDGETETLIRLKGDKAALYIMSCHTRPAFFFLKDQYLVLGVGTESVIPGNLREYDESRFHALDDFPDEARRVYDIHYPAPLFVDPGYFGAWSFSVRKGEISLYRM